MLVRQNNPLPTFTFVGATTYPDPALLVNRGTDTTYLVCYPEDQPVVVVAPMLPASEARLAAILRGASKLDGREFLAIGRAVLGSDARAA